MEQQMKALQALVDAGFSETVAASMIKSLAPKAERKKRSYFGNSTKREKINAPVVVNQTCVTCKTETSFKRVMQVYSDETDLQQSCIVGQCVNCIEQYRLMDKEDLIALIVIMNHVDTELRMLSTATQIKMAKKKSAIDWLTTKMNHAIAWGDKDENDSTAMEGVNLNLR